MTCLHFSIRTDYGIVIIHSDNIAKHKQCCPLVIISSINIQTTIRENGTQISYKFSLRKQRRYTTMAVGRFLESTSWNIYLPFDFQKVQVEIPICSLISRKYKLKYLSAVWFPESTSWNIYLQLDEFVKDLLINAALLPGDAPMCLFDSVGRVLRLRIFAVSYERSKYLDNF